MLHETSIQQGFGLSDAFNKWKIAICPENSVSKSRITLLHTPKMKLLRGTHNTGTGHGCELSQVSRCWRAGPQWCDAKLAPKKINAVAMTECHRGLTPESN